MKTQNLPPTVRKAEKELTIFAVNKQENNVIAR
jgi:hypothetical protein